MKLAILNSMEEVAPFLETWKALPLSNPFSSWDYACSWLQRGQVSPFLMVIRDAGGEVLALAPWGLEKRRGWVRQVSGIGGFEACFHDPWFRDPADQEVLSQVLVDGLLAHRKKWDALDLILRPEQSGCLLGKLEACGWARAEQPGDRQSRIVDFSEGWEAYWQSRPSEFRSDLRRMKRKLDRLPHRFLEASEANWKPLMETALAMFQARYDPSETREVWYEALRHLAAASSERGELMAYGLEVEGRWVAANVAFRAGDFAVGTLQSYDPAFASYGVGKLLTAWSYERMAAAGIRQLDLGDGVMAWKEKVKTGLCETTLLQVGASLPGKVLVGWRTWLKPRIFKPATSPAV